MNEFITFAHKLPYFNVTGESEWVPCTSGGHIVRTCVILNLPTAEYCPKCEAKVYNHSYETVKIKDIPLMKCPVRTFLKLNMKDIDVVSVKRYLQQQYPLRKIFLIRYFI